MASTIVDNMSNKIPCDRCGVCCSSGVCSHGVDDDRGLCAYLLINDHTDKHRTSCKLILDLKVNPADICIGKGCLLRHVPHAYTYYLEQMERKIEYIKMDVQMDKDNFYAMIRKDLKLAYPEKTDDELNKMIDKSYSKFKDVADKM